MRPIIITFLIALAVLSIPTVLDLLPGPIVHDEWAYLLQADTFARGRLANPPHAHWQFFETMHVLQQPTYAAKFPPLQGATLAVGQVLGSPIYGVIGTMALGCAAITWMLCAMLPARWAFVGGALAATHPLVFGWSQNYWGGGAALLASGVFLGGAIRVIRRGGWRDAVIASAGIGMLANCRPLEGLLLVLLCALSALWIVRPGALANGAWKRCAFATGVVLLSIGVWMLYYNHRVVGDVLRMPYAEHAAQYMNAPLFWWQSPRAVPAAYRHEALARFHLQAETDEWESQLGLTNFAAGVGRKLREIGRGWLWPPAAVVPVAVAMALSRRRELWLAVCVCAILPAIHFLITPWFRPHYLGVLAPLFFGIAAVGMRALWARGMLGATGVIVVFVIQSLTIGMSVRALITTPSIAGIARQDLIQQLHQLGGGHLVFIRYEVGAQTIFEWVANTAEIDRQQVVFARDMGERNLDLQRYYPDRRAWLVSVRGVASTVAPLPGE